MAVLSQQGAQIVQAVDQLPAEEQLELTKAMNERYFPANDADKTKIWMLLLGGLFAIALVAIICTVVLEARDNKNDTTALIAVTSAVIAGVIGLFSNPPTK